jgi:hypothetical protein
LHSFVDVVDGRGLGLWWAKECTIGLNHSLPIRSTLMSSIWHSPAAVTSSGISLQWTHRKFGWRDMVCVTWFLTHGMYMTSQITSKGTVRMSIWSTVRCGCVRIQHKAAWSECNKHGYSALCRLNFLQNITS